MDDKMMNFIDMNWDDIMLTLKQEGIRTRGLDYDDIEEHINNNEFLYTWAISEGVDC